MMYLFIRVFITLERNRNALPQHGGTAQAGNSASLCDNWELLGEGRGGGGSGNCMVARCMCVCVCGRVRGVSVSALVPSIYLAKPPFHFPELYLQ